MTIDPTNKHPGGRPRKPIDLSKLRLLLDADCTIVSAAKQLGVHRDTIFTHCSAFLLERKKEKLEKRQLEKRTRYQMKFGHDPLCYDQDAKKFVGIETKNIDRWRHVYRCIDVESVIKDLEVDIAAHPPKYGRVKSWRMLLIRTFRRMNPLNRVAYYERIRNEYRSRMTSNPNLR
jgi:hypothetical protein